MLAVRILLAQEERGVLGQSQIKVTGMIKRDLNSKPTQNIIPRPAIQNSKKYLYQWNINLQKILHP